MDIHQSYEDIKENNINNRENFIKNINIKHLMFVCGGLCIVYIILKSTPNLRDMSFFPFLIGGAVVLLLSTMSSSKNQSSFGDDNEYRIPLIKQLNWSRNHLGSGFDIGDGEIHISYSGVDSPNPNIKIFNFYVKNEYGYKKHFHVMMNRNKELLGLRKGKYIGEFLDLEQQGKYFEQNMKIMDKIKEMNNFDKREIN